MPAPEPKVPPAPMPTVLAACRGNHRGRPPVWIMRQAGRYLPEYREIRKRHSFVEMCTQVELAVEISLQPLRRFDFDAVIVFYDILYLAEAMGAPLEFRDDGPVFHRAVGSAADIRALYEPDLTATAPAKGTGAILASLRALRRAVPMEKALLGFAGAPFTLAAYLVEGRFGRSGDRVRQFLHAEPAAMHLLLERLARATGEYLAAQVEAGASAVQLFDTWAGILSRADYLEFVLPYHQLVFERLAACGAPRILYVCGGVHVLDLMKASGAEVLSLDWRHDLAAVRSRLGKDVALQGNLDPAALFAAPAEVKRRVEALLDSLRGDPAYIFNLGHGISKDTPVASVEVLVETIKGRE